MSDIENLSKIPIPKINADGELDEIVTLEDYVKLFFQEHRDDLALVKYTSDQVDNYYSLHEIMVSLRSRTVKDVGIATIVILFSFILITNEGPVASTEHGLGLLLLIVAAAFFRDARFVRSAMKEAESEFLKPLKIRRVTSSLAQQGIEYFEARGRIVDIVQEQFHYIISAQVEKDIQQFVELFTDQMESTEDILDSPNQTLTYEDLLKRQREFSEFPSTGVSLKGLLSSINSTEIVSEADEDDQD